MNTIEIQDKGTIVTLTLSKEKIQELVELTKTYANVGIRGEQNGMKFDIQMTRKLVNSLLVTW